MHTEGRRSLKISLGPLSQERLRQIIWEIGQRYPIPFTEDYAALAMVDPHRGHVHWHIRQESAEGLKRLTHSQAALFVVRIYDVTDILFDGVNAHGFFDLEVGGLQGGYYFRVDRTARNYMAEAGFRSRDGSFHALARSSATFFDRDRPSGNYQISGLYVGGASHRTFMVESVFDSPLYEKMHHELMRMKRDEPLRVAMVFLSPQPEALESPLAFLIDEVSRRLGKFGGDVRLFMPHWDAREMPNSPMIPQAEALAEKAISKLFTAHRQKAFHLIHCHDWYSSVAGVEASEALCIPLIVSLHSTEHERIQGNEMDRRSSAICEKEKAAVRRAALVIVPHSSTRQQVINLYGAPPEKVVIVPDVSAGKTDRVPPDQSEAKGWFGLNRNAPMVLFAGEISHAAGADILVDAIETVSRHDPSAQFVLAGDGPLKGELEARVWRAGLGHHCRFLGDVSRETFEALLTASDFVVIPARTWQGEGLAQAAIAFGKAVLTTRQSGINCIVHGENGLVTFDNPGSIVWGIQELLHNPRKGAMLRWAGKRKGGEAPSVETAAAQLYSYYAMAVGSKQGGENA